jgi:hypothetical protein
MYGLLNKGLKSLLDLHECSTEELILFPFPALNKGPFITLEGTGDFDSCLGRFSAGR